MTIYIPVRFLMIAGVGVAAAICLWVATVWLLEEGKQGGGSMKQYRVYAEVIATKSVAVVFAESEDDAVEKARIEAENVARDMGADAPEIVWAEEIVQ